MRIALVSHFFHPSVGGTEEVAQVLTGEFAKLGHEVRVITTTPCRLPLGGSRGQPYGKNGRDGRNGNDAVPIPPIPPILPSNQANDATPGALAEATYRVLRQPSPRELWATIKWSEVVLHNNLCLRMAWPLLFLHKPWVVSHHIWTRRMDGRRGPRDFLKLLSLRRARNLAVSAAIARDLPVPAEVVGNPYRDTIYRRLEGLERSKPLLFVGRLTAGKGLDLLIEALRILAARNVRLPLTVVGDGPDRAQLEGLVKTRPGDAGVPLPIEFLGRKSPHELARIYNEHRFLVIPSMWNEPFGLVALEAIACGCQPIGADDGGLPEAIGPCGRIFPKADAQALAELLASGPTPIPEFEAKAEEHLARFKAEAIAKAYLKAMVQAIQEVNG